MRSNDVRDVSMASFQRYMPAGRQVFSRKERACSYLIHIHTSFIFLNKKLIYLMLTFVRRYFWVCWHFNLDNFIPDFIGRKQSRLFCSCIKTFRISVPMIPGYMEDITNFQVNSIRVVRYYMLLYSNYFVRVLSTIVIDVIQWFEPARCIASDWLH